MSDFDRPKFDGKVLIIGGGVAGPALALALKKAGISSAVYEAYAYKSGVGSGFGLAPNGMKVLNTLGLAEKVIARGEVAVESVFYDERGKVLARYKNGTVEEYGQPNASLMRPALYDIMTEAMRAENIEVHYQKRLCDIKQTGQGVTAYFQDGTQAEGTILVGADGINSATRNITWPDAPKPAYIGITGVGGLTPAAALPGITRREKQSFNFTFGAKGFFGYSGVENGDVMWWSNLAHPTGLSEAELNNPVLEAVKQEMLAIYGDYHAPIKTLIENSQAAVKMNIYDIQSLPSWHKGRVLVIGDAAHAVSPNTGQGASIALEDALYLAKLLRDKPGDYEQIFAQFETDRKPRAEKIVAAGRRLGNDKKEVSPLQASIRNFMLRIFVGLFGRKSQHWLYSYNVDWNARA